MLQLWNPFPFSLTISIVHCEQLITGIFHSFFNRWFFLKKQALEQFGQKTNSDRKPVFDQTSDSDRI